MVNLAGVYAASFVNRRFVHNEMATSAVFFAVTLLALGALILFGRNSIGLSIALLAVVTSAMLGINTLIVTLVPLRFQKLGKVSTMTGGLNCLTYLGSTISSYGVGLIAQQQGWSIVQLCWLGLALMALFLAFLPLIYGSVFAAGWIHNAYGLLFGFYRFRLVTAAARQAFIF